MRPYGQTTRRIRAISRRRWRRLVGRHHGHPVSYSYCTRRSYQRAQVSAERQLARAQASEDCGQVMLCRRCGTVTGHDPSGLCPPCQDAPARS